MLRRVFLLLSIFTFLLAGLGAGEFKFPLQSNSVRFAAIGDMGSGDPPQYEVGPAHGRSTAQLPLRVCHHAGRQHLPRPQAQRL